MKKIILFLTALFGATTVFGSLILNEYHYDPHGDSPPLTPNGDANGDGTRDATDDEFLELVNTFATPLDLSGFTVADALSTRHTFPVATILAPGQALVLFGGGTPTGVFGGSIVQTASGGQLSLNNGGDSIIIRDVGASDVINFSYPGTLGSDQSVTLNPDLTGTFTGHLGLPSGLRFSPGYRNDGVTPFLIPEPSSGMLILLGGALIGMMARRRLRGPA